MKLSFKKGSELERLVKTLKRYNATTLIPFMDWIPRAARNDKMDWISHVRSK